jgi:hypothetical protein
MSPGTGWLRVACAALVATAVTFGVSAAVSRPLRCMALSYLPLGVVCVPGNPASFDPFGWAQDVADAAGVGRFAFISTLEAQGFWNSGTLDTRAQTTSLHFVFVDGAGTRYVVDLWDGVLLLSKGDTGEGTLDPYLDCSGREIWNNFRQAVPEAPPFGRVTYRREKLHFAFPQNATDTWIAESQHLCGEITGRLVSKVTVEGIYTDTLFRPFRPDTDYERARFVDCGGQRYRVSFGPFVSPVIWYAVSQQIPPNLQPFDSWSGQERLAADDWLGIQWDHRPSREDERQREVRIYVRARGEIRYGQLDFLGVYEARPARKNDCTQAK